MFEFFNQINIQSLEMKMVVVSFLILVNLIFSIVESFKYKTFNIKKLPEFISEWLMCVIAISVVEVLLAMIIDDSYLYPIIVGVQNIMIISIIACYMKKIYESFKGIGWDVEIDTKKINPPKGGK